MGRKGKSATATGGARVLNEQLPVAHGEILRKLGSTDRTHAVATAYRTICDRQPGAQFAEDRREFLHGLGDLRLKRLEHRILVAQGHELLQPARKLPLAGHRQSQVDPPGRDPCQGQRRGHRGRAARRVVQVPGDDQRGRYLAVTPAPWRQRHVGDAGCHATDHRVLLAHLFLPDRR